MDRVQRKTHETLALFFGKTWIERQLDKVKLDGYNNMNPMNIARMNMHPLIKAIVESQIKMSQSRQAGGSPIHVGKSEMLQSLLHENLTILEPELDRDDVERRLRDQDEFAKIEYELAIAAGYKRMGYGIEFLPRTPERRTGEFYVVDRLFGQKVLVECKKKDMASAQQSQIDNWWQEFQHLMTRQLKAEKKSYGIAIHIPLDPSRNETSRAAQEIMKKILANHEGDLVVVDGKYQVTVQKFADIGGQTLYRVVENFGSEADFNVSTMKQDKRFWPIGDGLPDRVSEAVKICAYSPSDFLDERSDSIMTTLKSAYGQLESDKPNIVYIDYNIALMREDRSRQLLSQLYPLITKKLERDYSKVSAVVLTNLKIFGDAQTVGFHANEECIINPQALIGLPIDFRVYGSRKNGVSILTDIHETLNRQ